MRKRMSFLLAVRMAAPVAPRRRAPQASPSPATAPTTSRRARCVLCQVLRHARCRTTPHCKHGAVTRSCTRPSFRAVQANPWLAGRLVAKDGDTYLAVPKFQPNVDDYFTTIPCKFKLEGWIQRSFTQGNAPRPVRRCTLLLPPPPPPSLLVPVPPPPPPHHHSLASATHLPPRPVSLTPATCATPAHPSGKVDEVDAYILANCEKVLTPRGNEVFGTQPPAQRMCGPGAPARLGDGRGAEVSVAAPLLGRVRGVRHATRFAGPCC